MVSSGTSKAEIYERERNVLMCLIMAPRLARINRDVSRIARKHACRSKYCLARRRPGAFASRTYALVHATQEADRRGVFASLAIALGAPDGGSLGDVT